MTLRARQRTVASRSTLAVRQIAPELGVDLVDGAPGALTADQGADFRLDGGAQHRRRARARDRRRERGALAYPQKPERPFVDASAAAGANAEDVPDGLVGFGEARNLAAVLGQERRRRAQKAFPDHIAPVAMLEGQLDSSGQQAIVGA